MTNASRVVSIEPEMSVRIIAQASGCFAVRAYQASRMDLRWVQTVLWRVCDDLVESPVNIDNLYMRF